MNAKNDANALGSPKVKEKAGGTGPDSGVPVWTVVGRTRSGAVACRPSGARSVFNCIPSTCVLGSVTSRLRRSHSPGLSLRGAGKIIGMFGLHSRRANGARVPQHDRIAGFFC